MTALRNFCLILAYDGTAYQGWQDNYDQPSVEGTLRKACEQILQHPVPLQAASRTDAGVHAVGQIAQFTTDNARANPAQLRHSLNSLLPADVRVLDVFEVPIDFHPTLHCTGKRYRYSLSVGPVQLPQERLYTWHVWEALDIGLMQDCAQHMVGTHNFFSLCNRKTKESYTSHVREVRRIECIARDESHLDIVVEGKSFLYKMVRNLVGTLVDIGRGKLDATCVPALLKGAPRTQAGITAPACGLTLERVFYDRC